MSAGARALLGLIGFYRRGISPLLGPRCRFTPTCSEYAQEAVQVHGAARGGWLAVVRIAKCAPWHRGGIDLVPGTVQAAHSSGTASPAGSRPCPPTPPPSEARVA
ncbi:membrane protein insertion efficiency factor YidD [Klenkia sp. PcliD-1-E]|uniref:membrane protein insertion efficiency factor YidD n=1 Tax=Klenkia sp. PcliD-1-E TaxID=2954492 RepID=UPI0020986451|nr:membrane protein insertion efficiency factor YidD [Klenkia sp. PcliD-1-E]MCO7221952.1 membrane protein insertion efficiency factor YidD [Klenkia sp. PcliD-1-E]